VAKAGWFCQKGAPGIAIPMVKNRTARIFTAKPVQIHQTRFSETPDLGNDVIQDIGNRENEYTRGCSPGTDHQNFGGKYVGNQQTGGK